MSATASVTPSAGSSKIGKAASVGHGVRSRTRRVVRRRGRGRLDGIESDEEIERETLSDVSDPFSDDSATDEDDSDAESEPESVLDDHVHSDTPSTTQSPPPGEVESAAALECIEHKAPASPTKMPAFLSSPVDWDDIVADADTNGDASVPIIDFANFNEHARPVSPSQSGKLEAAGPSATIEKESDLSAQIPRRDNIRRHTGNSARQNYQHRLQNDPSFVPTVGEFWGHDDRLRPKELRPLSDWWRSGRFRGRGRGRGAFVPRTPRPGQVAEPPSEARISRAGTPETGPEVPPIEKPWTHDGFEEMKTRDERRRVMERGGRPFSRGGGGGFVARLGRGGPFIPRRGGFSPSPTPGRGGSQFVPSHHPARTAKADRTWFAMKPERIWTKQFEGFLYFDPELKPKPGKGAAYRVSLPGKGADIVRVNAVTQSESTIEQSTRLLETQRSVEGSVTVTEQSRSYTVKVPSLPEKKSEEPEALPESLTTVEELQAELPPPATATTQTMSTIEPGARASTLPASSNLEDGVHPFSASVSSDTVSTPGLTRNTSLSDNSMSDIPALTRQSTASPRSEEHRDGGGRLQAPQLPPLQTVFSPPAQPSPTFTSPYNYTPPLPPGVAINQQGYAYEIATGRPVYLHPTPPPVPIYNPRPMQPPSMFIPGHMHHPSLPGDYLQAPHTPPLASFIDPTTGQPLFSLPRQSSRVEIRVPTDVTDGKSKADRGPSRLRSTIIAEDAQQQEDKHQRHVGFPPEPVQYVAPSEYIMDMSRMTSSHSYAGSDGAVSVSPGNDNRQLAPPPVDPSMMGFTAYPQQYYYPEQYYPAYVDLSQQPGHYEPYAEQRHQSTVYY